MQLPPCGLYRTTAPIAGIPAGRLVYFHNHGDPGPGLYVPEGWKANRAQMSRKGTTLPSPADVKHLEPLPPEGFYRVTEAFHCCDKLCRQFPPELLVQLGYNAEARPILFVPELVDGMLAIPQQGSAIEADRFPFLKLLKVAQTRGQSQEPHEAH